MSQLITVTREELLHQAKLSGQIPTLVEAIITRQEIAKAAKEGGIKVEAEELQKAADLFRVMKKLKSAEETWGWLHKNSLSLDDFEQIIYNSIISSKLSNYLFAEQVKPYFFAHKTDYISAVLYEVVLDDQDLAMELFYAIQEEEISFFEAARQHIKETELRRRGGYRGKVHRKDLKPEISSAVFTANPPHLLKPIITSQGVHLILVEEITQPELDEQTHFQISSELFRLWIKQQVEQTGNCYQFTI
jgi:parvulin-like peptidyl-prolyl isomerase